MECKPDEADKKIAQQEQGYKMFFFSVLLTEVFCTEEPLSYWNLWSYIPSFSFFLWNSDKLLY